MSLNDTQTQIKHTVNLHSRILMKKYLYTEEQEEQTAAQGQVARNRRKRGNNSLLSTK